MTIIYNNIRKLLSGFVTSLIAMLMLNGCSIITIDTMKNDLLVKPIPKTRASEKFGENSQLSNDVFIGIAMSGGGSRATNFSAAVLRNLDKLGILQHATVISSVSGSSLAAAYYGLYGDNSNNKEHSWDDKSVREAFLTNFERPWLISWFCPINIFRYWITNFSRSDIMANTLDNKLFHDHKYEALGSEKLPRIFINATSFTDGSAFVFSDEHFTERLNSRLDTYPVAKAVMASSAFPGVFHDITLKDYSVKDVDLNETEQDISVENYEHLIDGGPSDNLGVTPITRVLEKMPQPKKGCFLFVVDSYPYQEIPDHIQQADTRKWYDFIVDTNVATSSDIMLTARRKDLMRSLTSSDNNVGFNSYFESKNSGAKSKTAATEIEMLQEKLPGCSVWHINFQRLYSRGFEQSYGDNIRSPERLQLLQNVRKVVNSVPTRYKLVETEGYSPEAVQDYIFKAADMLIREDKDDSGGPILDVVCDKFKKWKLSGLKCNLDKKITD